MPRPKGSKNKKKTVLSTESLLSVEELQLQIDKTAQEVEEMSKTLKSKKADLKDLLKARERAEKYAAEAKAQEEQSRLLEAVEKSGKSIDEILAMLQ